MKKLLTGLAIVVLVAAAGIGIFIATFDADRFRPQLVNQIEQALGKPVQLERLSLGWENGIALQLHGVAIFEDQARREPLIEVESVSGVATLAPLLKKEIQVTSIVLSRPRIRASRDAQGRLNLLGLMAAGSPVAAAGQTTEGGSAAAEQPPVTFSIASLRIMDGTLRWIDAMASPPADVSIEQLDVAVRNIVPGQPLDVAIKAALGGSTPNVVLSGRLTPPGPAHPGSLDEASVMITRLPLESITPPAPADSPQLRGLLTVSLQGRAPSLDPAALTRTLSGTGSAAMDEAVLVNMNVLREVFNKLSMLPGLVDRLYARLPPEYRQKLEARDTVLESVAVSLALDRGLMRVQELSVQSDSFGFSGSGTVGLDGVVEMPGTVWVDPAFSAAIIRSVEELKTLTNAKGQMELPLTVRGPVTKLSVLPDVRYIASKVATTTAVDLLTGLLRKEKGRDQAEPGEAAQDQAAPDASRSPEEELVGQLLQGLLGPSE